jgi:8-oxo-dGTP pyrophosphatase MutT (NUDIX family)
MELAMHRSRFEQLLDQYKPAFAEEIAAKQRIQEFVAQHPDCFERTLAVGHITASSWLLSKDGSQALLMHHTKLNNWFQLGGHCDGDSDVLAVAIKEAQEESGIMGIEPLSNSIFDIDIHLVPANSREQEHYHYDIRFLLQVRSDEQLVQNKESKELRWVGKDRSALPTQSWSVVRMFDKWLEI